MTGPQTAADAAERNDVAAARVQAWLDGHNPIPPKGAVRSLLWERAELLADRTRTAAELEQVRGDWLTQAAQLNRIAGMVGHALILRACDDATPEEVRLALARACEDVHGVIGESEATRAQRTERYLVMCANLLNDHAIRERDVANERAEYAIDLLIAVTSPDSCMVDGFKRCLVHGEDLSSGNDCPQALARAFLAGAKAYRSVETTATRTADDKRTPEQWCAEYGIDIADPDGWRNAGDPAWDEPITLPDFLRRAARSTTRGLTPDVWNRLSREAHEAADVEKGPKSP